tara:strand:- start:52287 stop:53207 length:921 start_codon:yes stop_codon:yes gene_type:complete
MAEITPLYEEITNLFEIGKKLSELEYRGRFAPTPSGPLHIGNLRTALISWLKARIKGGKWLLRIDDLDKPRIRPGAIQSIQDDLIWLGLYWDESIIFQSQRNSLYQQIVDNLSNKNKIYACKCSRRILTQSKDKPSQDYSCPGKCRDLGLATHSINGRIPSLRLRASKKFLNTSGDIILKRSDGIISYHLASVVDDLTFGINEVIRGEDLASEMNAQLSIIEALNQKPFIFSYAPVLFNETGEKLSKRNSDYGLNNLREKGMQPEELIGLMAFSLGLVERGTSLSSFELLSRLMNQNDLIFSIIKS